MLSGRFSNLLGSLPTFLEIEELETRTQTSLGKAILFCKIHT